MEEEDYIYSNSTPGSHTLLHMAAGLLPLLFLSSSLHFTFSLTLSFALKKHASFIGKYGQHGGANKALKHATNCGNSGASTYLVVGYCHKMAIS